VRWQPCSRNRNDRNKPTSAGKYWSHAEDEQVCQELRKGIDFQQIAKTHNRTVGSIVARLIKLGKITAGNSGQLCSGLWRCAFRCRD